MHVLWRREGGTWSKLQDVNFLLSKKKDIVIFELHQIVARSVCDEQGNHKTTVCTPEFCYTVLFLLLPALGIFLCLQQEREGQYFPCILFVNSVFFFIVIVCFVLFACLLACLFVCFALLNHSCVKTNVRLTFYVCFVLLNISCTFVLLNLLCFVLLNLSCVLLFPTILCVLFN